MHTGGSSGPSRRGSGGGRRRRSHGSDEIPLQITSMADIFTILLVFLLKSYSVSAIDVDVGKDIKLPVANGGTESVEAMKVQVTANGITIEGKPVLTLTGYIASPKDTAADGTFPEVVKALKHEREKQRQIASEQLRQGGKAEDVKKNFDTKLLVIADKRVPYKLLKNVLASASAMDFTDFKLVVVTAE
ncbi:MAG: biopolymer transporter ExbD [Cryobacterium sp.]|nr:biopolymer transporter ExbD [Oligoflexia bacterium]